MSKKTNTLGGGPAGSVTFLLFMCAVAWLFSANDAKSALLPPTLITASDTLSSAIERGAELTRLDQRLAYRPQFLLPINSLFQLRWRTDLRTPEQEADRVRQDGRWYGGGERALWKQQAVFVAAEGEHFDDRPVASATQAGPTNSVRILRGGGGVHLQPSSHVDAAASLGVVEDRRLGRVESGLGLWTNALLRDLETGGYVHSGDLHYSRESPSHHENLDLSGQYDVFREFYPGNTNRAQVQASLIQRDIYMDQSGTLSKREDRRLAIDDALTYRVSRTLDARLAGDVLHDVTEQSQVAEERSRLEENQGGIQFTGTARQGDWTVQSDLGLRLITQTIREDVLRGSKTDLFFSSNGPVTEKMRGGLRLGVSKYRLDTRSDRNFDDRDELRFSGEAMLRRPVNRSLHIQTDVNLRLDHLVYIFKQNSANNRWTRYWGLGTTLLHEPSATVRQQVRALISANYIDYDFEQNARLTRSNIFRRLLVADSLTWDVRPRVQTRLRAQAQLEEFGRLFWDSFEEERSDNTTAVNASLEIGLLMARQVRMGIGGLWDSRRSVRYSSVSDANSEVAQDYRAYGPVWFAERSAARGLVLSVRGRHLRQFRLDKADRWLFTGEGAVSWVW